MKTYNIHERIQAYLDKRMNPEELKDFERDLKASPELKKEYTAALLKNLAGTAAENESLHNLLKEVYRESKPVELGQKPNPVMVTMRSNWIKMAAAAVVLLGFAYFNGIFDQPNTIKEFDYASLMVDPIGMERASVADLSINEKASNFYFRNPPATDSLEKMVLVCNGMCAAKYYLAHAYLKTKQFDKAKTLFSDLETNIDQLNSIPQLQGRENEVILNSTLAQLAAGETKTAVLPKLNKLLSNLDKSDTLRSIAVKLKEMLN